MQFLLPLQVIAQEAGDHNNLLKEVLVKIGSMKRCEGPVNFVARAPELPMVPLIEGASFSSCR